MGWQNSKNKTAMEMGLAMLKGRDLPRKYSGEAINAAVHILNRTKTVIVNNKTPYEAYYGKKLVITHLIIFGPDAFVHVQKAPG